MQTFEKYFQKHSDGKASDQLVKAVSFCARKDSALDLGAGTLAGTRFLLENGFKKVSAVDSSPESKKFTQGLDSAKFELKTAAFQDLVLPSHQFDLINAEYCLPYFGPQGFEIFINKIIAALKPDGIFTGQLFGTNDEWNRPGTELAFQTKEQAENLFAGTETVEFVEEEKDRGKVEGGQKHWHVFHFIVRKRVKI